MNEETEIIVLQRITFHATKAEKELREMAHNAMNGLQGDLMRFNNTSIVSSKRVIRVITHKGRRKYTEEVVVPRDDSSGEI